MTDAPPPRPAKPPRPCPICGRMSVAAFHPFCSKRCADIDLHRWLGGRYAIPGEPVDPEPRDEE
jgi:endogenous inhibitor of DNA gyrase (YacG/DUF329 family)